MLLSFFRKVNHPPWFRGANLDITNFTRNEKGLSVFSGWAGVIYPGYKDGAPVPDEDHQKVKFSVKALVPSFFKVQPKIDVNGTLSFEVYPDRIGIGRIEVTAVDSNDPPMESEKRIFSIAFRIITVEAMYPEIAIKGNEEISVNENSGLTIFRHFAAVWPFSSASSSASNALISSVFFEVRCDCNASCNTCDAFAQPPAIDSDGTLTFEPALGFYGSIRMLYRLNSTNGDATPWANVSVKILYVNQAPSFSIYDNGHVHLLEDAPKFERQMVYNIARGMWPEAAETGTHFGVAPSFRHNEDWQNWTFSVTLLEGNPAMMSTPPAINKSGALSFTLAPNENGVAVYAITLTDSGGTERGGVATSQRTLLTITVDAVNDPPSFSIPQSIKFTEIFTNDPLRMPGFAAPALPGWNVAGPANERNQSLNFSLVFVSGNPDLFLDVPQIAGKDLALVLTFAAYQYGNATYNVSVTDSGDGNNTGYNVSGSSLLTFFIDGVNQAPTIGLPPVIILWRNALASSPYSPPYMTVLNNCTCSPCPSPSCLSASSCCAPFQPSGSMTVVPAVARVSPGPYEKQQAITFAVTAQTQKVYVDNALVANGDLFSNQPSILVNGSLLLNLRPEATGHAVLSVTLTDDGGTLRGGKDVKRMDVNVFVFVGYVEVVVRLAKDSALTSEDVRAYLATESLGANSVNGVGFARVMVAQVKEVLDSSVAGRRLLFSNFKATEEATGTGGMPEGIGRRLLADGDSTVMEVAIHIAASTKLELASIMQKIQALTFGSQLRLEIASITPVLADGSQGEIPPSFDLPPNITVDEGSMTADPGAITNVQVGSTLLLPSGEQQVVFSVRVLRYKAPAQAVSWIESDGVGALFNAPPYVLATCPQVCTTATLVLNLTQEHGIADLEIVLYEPRGSAQAINMANKTVRLVVRPVPDAPYVQPAYAVEGSMVMVEDGGPCDVPECRTHTKLFNLSDVFGDADLWYAQGDFLTVQSDDAKRLNATVLRNGSTALLAITPLLHQHGNITVSAHDAYGLVSSPPLTVTVVHVNHAPYVKTDLSLLVLPEDAVMDVIDLSHYIQDVDVDDILTYEVQSLTEWLINASVHSAFSPLMRLQLLANQNGNGSILISVTDNHGLKATAILNISVVSVPDAPYPVLDGIIENSWGYIPAKLCARGNDPYFGLVPGPISLDECKAACLANDDCTAITYYTRFADRCFRTVGECETIDTASNAAVYTRPPGVIVNENSEPVFVDISNAFIDYDGCNTFLGPPVDCTYENDSITYSVLSNSPVVDASVMVANETSRLLQLTFARNKHTYPPVHATLTLFATDRHGLASNLTLNVTVRRTNQPPFGVQNGSAMLVQEASVEVPVYVMRPDLCPAGSLCMYDVDIGTDNDNFELSAFPEDPSFATVEVETYALVSGIPSPCFGRCRSARPFPNNGTLHCQVNATSSWYLCHFNVTITGNPDQFGIGAVIVILSDRNSLTAEARLNVSVQLKNQPPTIRVNAEDGIVTILESVDEELQYIHDFITVLSAGSPNEDACVRPSLRDVDCRSDNFTGQSMLYRVQQVGGDTDLMSLSPGITPDGVLSFATRAFMHGQAVYSVFAQDDAGTAFGGRDTSQGVNFTLMIQDVNFPPVFEFSDALNFSFESPTLVIAENSVPNSSIPAYPGVWHLERFARNIDPGGGGSEREQNITFIVDKVNNFFYCWVFI